MYPAGFAATPPNRSALRPVTPLRQAPPSWMAPERTSSIHIADRFGVRLRSLRKAHGMTQLEMAVEFGIDRSFISDVERGKKAISLPLLEVIAIGFGITMSELLANI